MDNISTRGIKVAVEPTYQKEQSKPTKRQFVFSYLVTIANESQHRVQLISRQWFIFDSAGIKKEVVGDGVIGEQPILVPGQTHQYQSWCPLMTDMGYMQGHFTMLNLDTGEEFQAVIPRFVLVPPYKMS